MKKYRIKGTTPKYLAKYRNEKTAAEIFVEHATPEQLEQFKQLDFEGIKKAIEPLIAAFSKFNDEWSKYRSNTRDLYMGNCMFYGYLTSMQDFAWAYQYHFSGILRAMDSLREFEQMQLRLQIDDQFKNSKYA